MFLILEASKQKTLFQSVSHMALCFRHSAAPGGSRRHLDVAHVEDLQVLNQTPVLSQNSSFTVEKAAGESKEDSARISSGSENPTPKHQASLQCFFDSHRSPIERC